MSLTDLHYYLGEAEVPALAPTSMESAVVGAIVYGPNPVVAEDESAITVHVVAEDDLTTSLGQFDQSKARRWIEVMDDAGNGSVVLANTDPDLALIAPRRLMQFRFYGWAAFTALIRQRSPVVRDQGEEAGQLTTVSGPGHIAKLDRSRVRPARGWGSWPRQDDRAWTWASIGYDDSAWSQPVSVMPLSDANAGWQVPPFGDGMPLNAGAYVVWDRDSSVEAPVGLGFVRDYFEAAGDFIVYCVADGNALLFLDGDQVAYVEGFHQVTTFKMRASAGDHVIGFQAQNFGAPDAPDYGGPAGLAYVVYAYDATTDLPTGTPLLVSGSVTAKGLFYPAQVPGWTWGAIALDVLDEFDEDGTLPPIIPHWTAELDSNGNPWEVIPSFTTRVGNDGFTVLAREGGGTYCDVHMSPAGWDLYLYRIGERGRHLTDVSFHGPTDTADPTSGNIKHLEQKRDLEPITALAVCWRDKWVTETDATAAATYGLNMDTLGLVAATEEEARQAAREQLAIFSRERCETTVELRDDPDCRPYWQWNTADWLLCDDDASETPTQSDQRVHSITVSEDENGIVSVAPTVGDLMRDAQFRHERAIKKIGLGTMDGRSDVANPVSTIPSRGPDCCPPEPPEGGGG